MKAFVPASDEQIFESSKDQPVPYRVGVPCFHWFVMIENQEGAPLTGRPPDDHPDSHPILMQSRR